MEDIGTVGEWAEIARSQERGDDNCIPSFYMKEVPDPQASETSGRPRFKEMPYVEIIVPGDKSNRPNRKVQDEDKARWPQTWAEFERNRQAATTSGTPIAHWPYLSRVQVAEFKAIGIMTVEALAGLDDSGLEKIGIGARELQTRARQFLQPQSETETELREENACLKSRVKNLSIEVEHLREAVESARSTRSSAEAGGQRPKRGGAAKAA